MNCGRLILMLSQVLIAAGWGGGQYDAAAAELLLLPVVVRNMLAYENGRALCFLCVPTLASSLAVE